VIHEINASTSKVEGNDNKLHESVTAALPIARSYQTSTPLHLTKSFLLTLLVSMNAEKIALDAEAQMLYKTIRGAKARGNTVSRVHIDKNGEVVEEVLVEHLHEAIGFSLDKKEDKTYFTDLGRSIYSVNFDGSGKKEIFKGQELGLDLTGIWIVHFD